MTATDDRMLEALLAESGLDDDPVIGDLVADLRMLADGPAPLPTPAVAALLAPRSARRRRGRTVVVGLLVAATLGGGAAAAAATPAVRDGAGSAVSSILGVSRPAPITRDQPVAVPATDAAPAGERPAPTTVRSVAPRTTHETSSNHQVRGGSSQRVAPTVPAEGRPAESVRPSPSPSPSSEKHDSAVRRGKGKSVSGTGHGSGKGHGADDGSRGNGSADDGAQGNGNGNGSSGD